MTRPTAKDARLAKAAYAVAAARMKLVEATKAQRAARDRFNAAVERLELLVDE